MTYEASFTYSPAIARRVYLHMLWEARNGLVITTPVFLFLAARRIALDVEAPLAWFAVGVVATLWVSWWLNYIRVGRARSAVGSQVATFVVDDDACEFRTAQAETIVRWSAISRLYQFRKDWVLVRKGGLLALAVPAASLSDEAKAFLEDRVRGSGGFVG